MTRHGKAAARHRGKVCRPCPPPSAGRGAFPCVRHERLELPIPRPSAV